MTAIIGGQKRFLGGIASIAKAVISAVRMVSGAKCKSRGGGAHIVCGI